MLDAKGLEAAVEAGDEHCRHTGLPPRLAYYAAISAYLEAVGGEPVAWMHPRTGWVHNNHGAVAIHCPKAGPHPIPLYTAPQAPAVQVKGLADKLKLAEYVMTKDSFCEAERLEEGLSVVRRIRSALEAETGGGETAYEPCGGCGNADPDNRCLGCLHPFVATTPDERAVEALPNWNGWRSIDTAPEDCRVILATSGNWVGEAIMLRDEDTGEQIWTWVDTGKPSRHSCYGWQHLPEALSAPVASDLRPDGFDGPTGAE